MKNPITIVYYESGEILSKEWFINGNYHNGRYHREDGPALFVYYESGKIQYEEWYLNNKQHRTNGPASISYYLSGEIKNEYWCLNGKDVYPEDWLQENRYEWPLDDNQQAHFILTFA